MARDRENEETYQVGQVVLTEHDLEFTEEYNGDVFTLKYPAPYLKAAIEAEIAQHTTLSGGDSMMEHFLCGELDQAWNVAQHIETNDIMLSRFVELIEREYRKAAEFDDLLDSLK